MTSPATLLDLLYEAMTCEVGLLVRCTDARKLSARLAHVRKKDPSFQALSFVQYHLAPTTELLIVKKEAIHAVTGKTQQAHA